jgi:hypothetical protein
MQLKAQQVISACQEVRSVVARVIYFNLMDTFINLNLLNEL